MDKLFVYIEKFFFISVIALFGWISIGFICAAKTYWLGIVFLCFVAVNKWYKTMLFYFLLILLPIIPSGTGSPFSECLIMFLLAIWITNRMIERKRIWIPKPTIYMGILVTLSLASLISKSTIDKNLTSFTFLIKNMPSIVFFPLNYHGLFGIRELFTIIESALLFLFVINTMSHKNIHGVFVCFLTSGIIVAVISLIEYLTHHELPSSAWQRTYGTFANPNILGGYFAIVLSMLYPILFNSNKLIYWAIFTLVFIALLICGSKGALLACLSTLIIYAWLRWKSKNLTDNASMQYFGAICFALVVAIICLVSNKLIAEYLSQFSHGRLTLWSCTLDMIKSSPLFGVGLGQFGTSYKACSSFNFASNIEIHAHNIYFHCLAELGIIGFLICYYIFRLCMQIGLKKIGASKNISSELIILLPIVSVLIHGFVDSVILFAPIAFLFSILLGFYYLLTVNNPTIHS